MALEIERKFLVISDAWREQAQSRELLRQGYLASGAFKPGAPESGARCSIRARIAGEKAWLTIKARRSGMTRQEFEYPIPLSDAHEILGELCNGPLVEKYRHEIKIGAYVWEVDEFLGDNQGLVVAEIELAHETDRFERPAWLGNEVTDDQRYYNFNLAQRPYGEWK